MWAVGSRYEGYSRSAPRRLPMPDSATILLVDDEESVQKLLTYPLERDGYRVVQARDGDEAAIEVDGLRIDPSRRTVELDGAPVPLTYVEFELLRTLAARPGRVFSRQALLLALWGGAEYREPRTIDVHVRHLREKLEADAREPEYILTVRGVGYRFRDA